MFLQLRLFFCLKILNYVPFINLKEGPISQERKTASLKLLQIRKACALLHYLELDCLNAYHFLMTNSSMSHSE